LARQNERRRSSTFAPDPPFERGLPAPSILDSIKHLTKPPRAA